MPGRLRRNVAGIYTGRKYLHGTERFATIAAEINGLESLEPKQPIVKAHSVAESARQSAIMNSNQQGKVTKGLANLAAELNPLKSITFLLALVLISLAGYEWLKESGDPRLPFPFYGTIAASYAGGFLIGRVFWRMVKTAAIMAAIVLGGLAVLNRAHVDTSKVKQETEAGSAWARNQAGRAKHYLMHLLPSGGAAGLGVFAGSRRRAGHGGKDGG